MKPTSATLQLDNRSVKIPRGVVEDLLVQIDKFYYLVDFLVLDTHPISNSKAQIPVILGCPFLATSNAIINCRNDVLKFSFGNMTLKMNIFNICKQPGDNNDLHEVDFIDELVHENFGSTLPSDPLEACLIISNDFALDINSKISHMLSFLNTFQDSKVSGWRPKFEKQPPQSSIPIPLSV